jgi:hypothetical protein
MITLTILDADHRADIDADLEGRWETARDDAPGGSPTTKAMADIDAALAWIAASDTGAYPLTLTATDPALVAVLAITLENLEDA